MSRRFYKIGKIILKKSRLFRAAHGPPCRGVKKAGAFVNNADLWGRCLNSFAGLLIMTE